MHSLAFFLGCLFVARYRCQSRGTVVWSLSKLVSSQKRRNNAFSTRQKQTFRSPSLPEILISGGSSSTKSMWVYCVECSAWQCLLGSLRKEWILVSYFSCLVSALYLFAVSEGTKRADYCIDLLQFVVLYLYFYFIFFYSSYVSRLRSVLLICIAPQRHPLFVERVSIRAMIRRPTAIK